MRVLILIIYAILLIQSKTIYCQNYYTSSEYDIVFSNKQNKYYVISNGFFYEIHGTTTLDVLRSGLTSKVDPTGSLIVIDNIIGDISILSYAFNQGDTFPALIDKNSVLAPKSSKDLIKLNMNTLNYIFYGDKSLIYDIYDIPYESIGLTKLMNSAMVPVDGVYLCIHRKGFYWLDKQFKLDLSNTKQNINFFQTKISEEDHRLLTLPNGDILTVFTAILDTSKSSVNKAGIRFLKRTVLPNGKSNFTISNQTVLYKDNIDKNLESGFEKNWSPFNYGNEIFFIQSFQPFRIYKFSLPNKRNSKVLKYKYSRRDETFTYFAQSVDLVSTVDCRPFTSYFGQIRGGTQALMVRGQYLAFLHTYQRSGFFNDILPDCQFYYLIGAYTFTSDPPFQVTSMSRFPISHETFVPGEYKKDHPPALLTFAMSYVLIDNDGSVILEGDDEDDPHTTTVVLTIGVRDTHTIVAKINLNELLDSLKPVVC